LKNLAKEFKKEEIERYKFRVGPIDKIKIKPSTGISCNVCQVVIQNEEIKYYCFICDIYFCYECAYRNFNLEGFSALIHKEHYLLAFTDITNKDLLNNISRYKLGFNLYSFNHENALTIQHNFGCDNCEKTNNDVHRYICLNCDEGLMPKHGLTDICENCFNNVYINNQQFKANNKHKKNHVYLWMFYNGMNYYNY
jgi:hypothetical protein